MDLGFLHFKLLGTGTKRQLVELGSAMAPRRPRGGSQPSPIAAARKQGRLFLKVLEADMSADDDIDVMHTLLHSYFHSNNAQRAKRRWQLLRTLYNSRPMTRRRKRKKKPDDLVDSSTFATSSDDELPDPTKDKHSKPSATKPPISPPESSKLDDDTSSPWPAFDSDDDILPDQATTQDKGFGKTANNPKPDQDPRKFRYHLSPTHFLLTLPSTAEPSVSQTVQALISLPPIAKLVRLESRVASVQKLVDLIDLLFAPTSYLKIQASMKNIAEISGCASPSPWKQQEEHDVVEGIKILHHTASPDCLRYLVERYRQATQVESLQDQHWARGSCSRGQDQSTGIGWGRGVDENGVGSAISQPGGGAVFGHEELELLLGGGQGGPRFPPTYWAVGFGKPKLTSIGARLLHTAFYPLLQCHRSLIAVFELLYHVYIAPLMQNVHLQGSRIERFLAIRDEEMLIDVCTRQGFVGLFDRSGDDDIGTERLDADFGAFQSSLSRSHSESTTSSASSPLKHTYLLRSSLGLQPSTPKEGSTGLQDTQLPTPQSLKRKCAVDEKNQHTSPPQKETDPARRKRRATTPYRNAVSAGCHWGTCTQEAEAVVSDNSASSKALPSQPARYQTKHCRRSYIRRIKRYDFNLFDLTGRWTCSELPIGLASVSAIAEIVKSLRSRGYTHAQIIQEFKHLKLPAEAKPPGRTKFQDWRNRLRSDPQYDPSKVGSSSPKPTRPTAVLVSSQLQAGASDPAATQVNQLGARRSQTRARAALAPTPAEPQPQAQQKAESHAQFQAQPQSPAQPQTSSRISSADSESSALRPETSSDQPLGLNLHTAGNHSTTALSFRTII
ncbi:MAG: hypothetical protein Q9194_007007 [Teloschistes cf. exilis]